MALAVRIVTLAQDAVMLDEVHGREEMVRIIGERRGGAYGPELADILLREVDRLMADIGDTIDRETILALEPEPHGMLDAEASEEAYLAVADMIDMRMPHTFGHSRAVAALAEAAARKMGCPTSTSAMSEGRR